MSSQIHTTAVLVDLHTASSIPNHINLIKSIINNDHINDISGVIQLYILTSPLNNVTTEVEKLVCNNGHVNVTSVEADELIASFYSAKQKLDELDITKIKLICDKHREQFWSYVCQLLFTPVHEWSIEVVTCPLRNNGKLPQGFLDASVTLTEEKTTTLTFDDTKDNQHISSVSYPSARDENIGPTSLPSESNRTSDDTMDNLHFKASSSEKADLTLESVKTQVQRFLQTLPSNLAAPEVDRSKLLPGQGSGFVHGYSTRRGGVTTLPTLCAMNLMYTAKKRDSPLVVEENTRRLSLAGGFDPQHYHLVKVEHGTTVWTVGEQPPLKYDALVTNRYDVTIAAAGADCIPLLFADPVNMAIGAAHAGWMGTMGRVAECVVKTMGDKFGSRPEDIRVSMGPGLRLGCFRVLQKEGEYFSKIHPSCQVDSVGPVSHTIYSLGEGNFTLKDTPADSPYKDAQVPQGQGSTRNLKTHHTENDTEVSISKVLSDDGQTRQSSSKSDNNTNRLTSNHHLRDFIVKQIPTEQLKAKNPRPPKDPKRQWTFVDLQMTNYHVLLQAGVKAEHIDMSTSHCTKCNPHLYFSYERDGFPFGNQVGFICMPSEYDREKASCTK